MAKIKIIQPTFDKVTNKKYEVGTIVDLGASRNKRAVETNQAVYLTESEKKETGNVAKKKVTKAGSQIIETKDNGK
jgi:hypothetical protein